uniref:NET domain-containing protein n=1 Tax=Leersia perrieri TaxID=77586 RepID=A0A0D9WF73_9ORYZ
MAVGTAPPPAMAAALPCDRRLMERIESERLAVCALLKKAEGLVAQRKANNGAAAKEAAAPRSDACAPSRRGKKTRPVVIPSTDGDAFPKKRRKTGPMVEVEVIGPTMPMAQRDRLTGLLSSLSAEMPLPPHIVGFIRSQCCCFVCPDSDEMDVDLRSTKDSVLFKLLNLLDEFAQQQTKIQKLEEEEKPERPKIEAVDSSDAIGHLEDGEIVDEDLDIGGGVSPLLVVDNLQFSSLPKKQEEDDELIDICGGVSPVSVSNFPETENSPSSSSSSSRDSSSSSSSGSGSSCSSSSDNDSDSDSDEDTASSSPQDTSGLPIEAEVKPLLEEQQLVTEQHKELITERAASPHTEMQELIARAQEKQKLQHRKRAREQLEEMKSTAPPVYEGIDPRLMKQLGITKEVEYMVSPVFSRDRVRRHGGGILQKLGYYLKP